MPRVLVAPDKFKGTLPAADVARAVAAGLRRARPDVDVECLPVADGGDGTLDAAVSAGFERVPVTVSGPTGEPVETAYARRGTPPSWRWPTHAASSACPGACAPRRPRRAGASAR